jgi:hypothetical protein
MIGVSTDGSFLISDVDRVVMDGMVGRVSAVTDTDIGTSGPVVPGSVPSLFFQRLESLSKVKETSSPSAGFEEGLLVLVGRSSAGTVEGLASVTGNVVESSVAGADPNLTDSGSETGSAMVLVSTPKGEPGGKAVAGCDE